MSGVALNIGSLSRYGGRIGSLSRQVAPVPLWLTLIREAEAAAQAAGASLWYVPPAGYADRSINGPFVGSDGGGGVPAVGSGPVGFLRDAANGPINTPNIAPSTASTAAWTPGNGGTLASFGGEIQITANGSSGFPGTIVSIPVISGRWYRLEVSGRQGTSTSTVGASIRTGGDIFYNNVFGLSGSPTVLRQVFRATTASLDLNFFLNGSPAAAGTGFFGSLTIQEMPGNHAGQGTSGNRPILVAAPGAAAAAAGFGALSFDGVDDNLSTSLTSGAAFTAIVAITKNSTTDRHLMGTFNAATTNGFLIQESGGSAILQAFGAGFSGNPNVLVPAPGNPHVIAAKVGGAVGQLRVNGGTPAPTSSTGAVPSTNTLQIGRAPPNFTPALDGTIHGACFAPVAMSDAQEAAVARLFAFISGANYVG